MESVKRLRRTPLALRKLPAYTAGEEIANVVTHAAGGLFGLIAASLTLTRAIRLADPFAIASSAVYGFSLILLYLFSSLYHAWDPAKMGKRVMQVVDHCTIFLLIAGTYTPYCLCTLRHADPLLGWVYFGTVWSIALLGIVLNAIDLRRYAVFSNLCYLLLGWCIILRAPLVVDVIGVSGFALLLSGGIAYTVGTLFYAIGRRVRYCHSVFHVFVLAGTLLQFLSIYLYVL